MTGRSRSAIPFGLGLEVWLIGTPAELDAAARALASTGAVAYHSGREPMTGADRGRLRTYARIHVRTAPRPAPAGSFDEPATLPDLAA